MKLEMGKYILYLGLVFILVFTWLNSSNAQQGTVIYDTIQSPSLEGNLLGESSTKPMAIYLPPNYDKGDQLYPVIYFLHGYTMDHNMWVNIGIKDVMDDLIKQGKVQQMIIVMPSVFNKLGGSAYANSPVTGNNEDYLTKDLVKYIDNKYRTLEQRESRAIGGASRGGYGAVILAMKYPTIYSVVVSHSGVLSLNRYKESVRLNPNWILGAFPVWGSVAVDWSPNPDKPPLYYDYPADDNGNIIDSVWQRWLEHDPVTMVGKYKENLKQLKGIYFDQGRFDSVVSILEPQDFDKTLTEAGIPHTYEEYDGDHGDQWASRLYTSLPFISKLLKTEVLTGTESRGKLATAWGQIRIR
jgi:S-formylglutathione hydrolase